MHELKLTIFDSAQRQYCECYAGNVKCSSQCRCIGCQNISPGGFGPGGTGHGIAMRESGGVPYEIPVQAQSRVPGREPWMMNAAQNLVRRENKRSYL